MGAFSLIVVINLLNRLKMPEAAGEFEFQTKKVIVDTSALIKAPLDEISKFSETLYTVDDVLKELRDQKTKHKLAFVPNYLHVLTPCDESYKFVCEFSKKAGCYQSLSVADLRVMALSHQLFVQEYGPEAVNTEPKSRVVVSSKKPTSTDSSDSAALLVRKEDEKIPGFYNPSSSELSEQKRIPSSNDLETNSNDQSGLGQTEELGNDPVENVEDPENEDLSSEDDQNDDVDDDGWITKSNIKEAQLKMNRLHVKDDDESEKREDVACVTLDFAMQRVLQQMGVAIMSVDGVKMSNLKSYVLRCFACMSKTPDVTKIFCPECGSKTLRKLFYSVADDGSVIYHFSKNYVHNKRGFRYHAPRPQGGKHGQNPWVAEDQRFPLNQAPKKSNMKNLPLDPDYVANTSPFTARDTHSRYFNTALGTQQTFNWMQKNPNENKGMRSKKR